MFGNLFGGVTKDTFMHKRSVPANPNDAFYGPKCLFCWGLYDDSDHAGVRMLPCNHIMGRSCLAEFIDTPNGDKCPTCRTPLFQPSLAITIERYAFHLSIRMFISILPWMTWFSSWMLYFKSFLDPIFDAILPSAPQNTSTGSEFPKMVEWVLEGLMLLVNQNNIYYFAYKLADSFTDLYTEMRATARWAYFFELVESIVRLHAGIAASSTLEAKVCRAWIIAVCAYLWRGHGRVRGFRDRITFAVIMIAAVVANLAVKFVGVRILKFVADELAPQKALN